MSWKHVCLPGIMKHRMWRDLAQVGKPRTALGRPSLWWRNARCTDGDHGSAWVSGESVDHGEPNPLTVEIGTSFLSGDVLWCFRVSLTFRRLAA